MVPFFLRVCVRVCVCVWLIICPRCLKIKELHELSELDENTLGRPHIDFASRFPPRQLGARTIVAGDQMQYVSRSGGDNTRHRGLEEDRRRIGGAQEEDWRRRKMIGGMEEDGKRLGGELQEDWRRIGGGLEEDWGRRRIGGGLEEDWKRLGGGLEESYHISYHTPW